MEKKKEDNKSLIFNMKIHYCKLCKGFVRNKIKGEKEFTGTRKQVRDHLVKVHKIRGRKNIMGITKKEFGESEISLNTGSRNLE